jgi:hypothetical protein
LEALCRHPAGAKRTLERSTQLGLMLDYLGQTELDEGAVVDPEMPTSPVALTVLVAVTGCRYRDRIAGISTLIATHGPDLLPPGVAIIGGALVVIGIHGL